MVYTAFSALSVAGKTGSQRAAIPCANTAATLAQMVFSHDFSYHYAKLQKEKGGRNALP